MILRNFLDFAVMILWEVLAVLEDKPQPRLLLMVRIVPEWLADFCWLRTWWLYMPTNERPAGAPNREE